ncbi:hypothetical protein LARI1_G004554 [Lachnellula arida]|uniref:Uncharacterized protein n=1 Tax=Lachnellula arida TaxID=1316785 RepID=A0A8T9BMS1_9HELO|nr:hypothetical protein LARI1_G004554 [Lachnellula arida]
MQLSASFALALLSSSLCAASEKYTARAVGSPTNRTAPHSSLPRDSAVNCSIGIARWSGTTLWDVTVYNVPQPQRQDTNVMATLKNQNMGKGANMTVSDGVPSPITISNVDNAPVFDYNTQDIRAPVADPDTGRTKVQLRFDIPGEGYSWTTDDCGAGSVVYSAGIESWSCDFPCAAASAKEL